MKRVPKKALSFFLMFLLVFGLIPVQGFAEDAGVMIESVGADPATPLPDDLAPGEVWTDKSVVHEEDGVFTVTLTAIGKEFEAKTSEPVDVVLVLDTSGSMAGNKMNNMKAAAKETVSALLGGSNNNNQVAVVSYQTTVTTVRGFTDNVSNLRNSIDGLSSGGGTNIQGGILRAETLLRERSRDSKPVIILLSDGEPTYYYNSLTDHSIRQGNGSDTSGIHVWQTVLQAMEAKNNIEGLRIYTIGFGVGAGTLAEAALMPTDEKTSNYRHYTGEIRTVSETKVVQYYQTILRGWSESSTGSVGSRYVAPTGTAQTESGWEPLPFPTYQQLQSTDWGSWNRASSPNSESEWFWYDWAYRQTALFDVTRTKTEYRSVSRVPFNHQYWEEEGSTITGTDLDSIRKTFKEISTRLTGTKPIDETKAVVFTDLVGDGFEIVAGTLPTGVSRSGNTITWTIDSDNFNTVSHGSQLTTYIDEGELGTVTDYDKDALDDVINQVSFQVKIAANEAGKYYTNYNSKDDYKDENKAGASAAFTPASGNPYYSEGGAGYDEVVNGKVTSNLLKSGWLTLKKAVADLTIKKNVVAYDGSNKGDLANDGFEFTVSLGLSGTIYGKIYNEGNESPVGSFSISPSSKTFKLKDGQYAVISDIPLGTSYTVSETDYTAEGYVTTTPENCTGDIGELADPVVFTNTYYPSADIHIKKEIRTLYDRVTIPDGVKFPFGLYQKIDDDEYAEIMTDAASVSTENNGKEYTATMNVKIKTLAELFDASGNVTLYIHEEALEGENQDEYWTLDDYYYPVTIHKSGTVTYENKVNSTTNPVVVTNEYEPTSQLSVRKEVEGDGDTEKEFDFTIEIGTLKDYDYKYVLTDGSGEEGQTEQGIGTGEAVTFDVSLTHNQTAVITGIPVGTPYTVTEADYSHEGYYSDLTDNKEMGFVGIDIDEDGNLVDVINTYATQNLTVSKVVAGIETSDQFDFNVSYGSMTEPSFSLGHDESKVLEAVPVGATYTVKETPVDGYKTTVSMKVGDEESDEFTYNAATGECTFTLTEADTEIIFTNTFKTGELTVSKSVVGAEPEDSEEEYGIKVTFSGSSLLSEIDASIGGEPVTTTTSGVYEITLKVNEHALFTNIPEGVSYTVVETDPGRADSWDVTYVDDKNTITDGDQNNVVVTNTYETPSKLTISKIVPTAGYSALKGDEEFGFTIKFFAFETRIEMDEEDEPQEPELVPYKLKNHEKPAGLTEKTGKTGVYTFTLKAGESLEFDDLPVGVMYEVEETDRQSARESALTVNSVGQAGLIAEGKITSDAEAADSIVYYNHFNIDTGKLTLKKEVTGNKKIAPESFQFQVTFKGQTDVTLAGSVGTIEDNSITFDVTLGRNGVAVFKGIKEGTKYEITEITEADRTTFTPNKEGEFELNSDGWRVKNIKVTCTNHYALPKTITEKDAYFNGKLISDNIGGVYVGDVVAYKITVTNQGPHAVTLDRIRDAIFGTPVNDIVVTGPNEEVATGFELDTTGDAKYLVLTDGVVIEKGESLTVSYNTSYDTAGMKTNTARSYATYHYAFNDGESGSMSITSKDDARIKVFNPSDIELVKKVAVGSVRGGNHSVGEFKNSVTVDYKDFVTYKITATNTGEGRLHRAAITDYQLTKGNVDSVTLNGVELEEDAYTIHRHVLKLKNPLKANDKIEIVYSLEAPKDYRNIAFVKAHDGLNSLKDKDTARVKVRMPQIEVEKTANNDGPVLTGGTVDYTITITNTYGRDLDLMSVTDSFFKLIDSDENGVDDRNIEVGNISYSIGGGEAITVALSEIDDTTGTIRFGEGDESYPTFKPDQVVEFTYTVTFHEAGYYDNVADATAAFRGKAARDGDSANVRVKDPSGTQVEKTVNNLGEVTIRSGETVTYKVKVTNTGDVALNLATFEDAALAASGTVITGLDLIGGESGATLEWKYDEDDRKIIHISYKAPGSDDNGEDGNTEEDAERILFLEPGMSVLLTYTRAMTSQYTNEVIATLYEEDGTILTDDGKAIVKISSGGGNNNGGDDDDDNGDDDPPLGDEDEDTGVLDETDKDEETDILADADKDAETGVAGDSDKLPQTGGISAATLMGLFGVMMAGGGGTAYIKLRRKSLAKEKNN